MLEQRSHVLAAVSRRIFDLLADRAQGPSLPRHRSGSEAPPRISRYARGIEIRRVVTRAARKTWRTVSVDAAHHQGLVRRHPIGLRGPVARRMAVQATRALKDLARLLEQCDRSRHRRHTVLATRVLRCGAGEAKKRGSGGHDERARHINPPACGPRRGLRRGCVYRWRNDRGCRLTPDQCRGPSAS